MIGIPDRKKFIIPFVQLLFCFTLAQGQSEERGTIMTLTERGHHENGMRTGVWEYYDHPQALSLKVDYAKGRLLYVRSDSADFHVLDNGRWVKKKLAVPCRFNGSITTLIDHYDQFRVPDDLFIKRQFFSAWLTFEVGPDGTATNPEVHQDPGNGVKEYILELFRLAPNSWIPGVDDSGKIMTCLMAIRFDFCEVCQTSSGFPAKVLFTGIDPPRQGPLGGLTPHFSFSPNNSQLLAMPYTNGMTSENPRATLFRLTTGENRPVPFAHNTSVWWLDDDHILFMPKYYSRTPEVLATLELSTNKVTFLSDSTTSSHLLSPNRRQLVFTTSAPGKQTLHLMDLSDMSHRIILQSTAPAIPDMWSPDGRFVALRRRDGGVETYTIVDIASGTTWPLPVLGAPVVGWSQDGNRIYQHKSTRDEYRGSREMESPTSFNGIVRVTTINTTTYEPISEIFETDLTSKLLRTIYKKRKQMAVSYSPAKNKLLLMMDGHAYLMDSNPDAKPVKIIEKCQGTGWSNDGEFIAYLSSRDQQLHLYTVQSGRSEFLTMQKTRKEK